MKTDPDVSRTTAQIIHWACLYKGSPQKAAVKIYEQAKAMLRLHHVLDGEREYAERKIREELGVI